MPFDPSTAQPIGGFDPATAKPVEPEFDWLGATRQVLQGLTLGGSDEAQAGIRAVIDPLLKGGAHDFGGDVRMDTESLGERYRRQHATLADEREAFREDNPVLAPALEIGGGLMTGIATAPKLAGMRGINALGQYKKAAAIGGLEGGVYGGLTADPGERAQGTAMGATVGGAAAPAMLAAGNVAGNLLRPVGRKIHHAITGTPRGDAARTAGDMLVDAGYTSVEQAAPKGARFSPTLADVSEVRPLAAGLAADPELPQTVKLAGDLIKRNKGLFGRVTEALDEGLKLPTNANWHQVSKALKAQQGQKGRELYALAEAKPLDLSQQYLGSIFKGKHSIPEVNKAIRRAKQAIQAETLGGNPQGHFTFLNEWKMAMDDQIGGLLRGGSPRLARKLINIKNRAIKEADEQIPEYAAARQAWAEDAQVEDAGKLGAAFFREGIDELADLVQTMGAPEKVAFRLGVKKAVRDKLMQAKEGDMVINRIGSMANMEKLRLAFDDDAAFNAFKRELDVERNVFETYRMLMQNSKTGVVQRAQAILSGKGSARELDAWGGDAATLLANAMRRVLRTGLSREAKEELGTVLLTSIADLPPEMVRKINRTIQKRLGKEAAQEVGRWFDQLYPATPTAMGVVAGEQLRRVE